MSYTVTLGGDSADSYIISGARTEKLCLPGQEWEVWLDFDCPLPVKPWSTCVIREDGTKVLTGYAASVTRVWSENPAMIVAGVDTWKRATDCWNDEEYVTGVGDTVQSMIRRFLDMAGLSYQINTDWDVDMIPGMVISYQPVSEIVLDLCSALNLFVRINPDGTVLVGDVVSDGGTGPELATGDNMMTIDVLRGDYRARNKIIVWGPASMAIVRSDEDWAVVDHTMVYASPYCADPWSLANAIHSNLHTVERVTTVEHTGDPDRRVGQECQISGPPITFDGKDICTTIKSSYNEKGYVMSSIFGERCAIFGAGPGLNDGRDVIVATHECGVWRCRDIWAEGGPHWEPLNNGLSDTTIYNGVDYGSTFKCEWFIRDPYLPNTMAFLLTEAGILRTDSLEPGYEYWKPVWMNYHPYMTEGGYYVSKIRSTVAREGTYYIALGSHPAGKPTSPLTWVGITDNRFATVNGPWTRMMGPTPPTCDPVRWSGVWGNCNFGWQKYVSLPTWHRGSGYAGGGGSGGFAAWHRNDAGCTISGVQSSVVSNGGPAYWNCKRYDGDKIVVPYLDITNNGGLNVTTQGFFCFGTGGPLDPLVCGGRPIPTDGLDTNPAQSWLHMPSVHIPYDQKYNDDNSPSILYFSPGVWVGGMTTTTASMPTRNGTPLLLPWGSAPADCHRNQGSIGTYSPDRTKVSCWSYGKPSRFAYSNDEGDSWTEMDSVPVKTSVFSGFPYSDQKVYAGRDPGRDPTAPGQPPDMNDTPLIYVSWDRGATWPDVTGDLWTNTQALAKRYVGVLSPVPAGSAGLVTIAPRYS